MDDFIVFRCNPENQKKLVYLMLGLNCDVPIIEAIYFLALGSTFQKEWEGFINALQLLLEAKLTQKLQVIPEDRNYSPFKYKSWHLHSLFWNPHGPTAVERKLRCITFVRALVGAINIDKSPDGSLSIETAKGFNISQRTFATDTFRLGQFESTLDAHLALLFKD